MYLPTISEKGRRWMENESLTDECFLPFYFNNKKEMQKIMQKLQNVNSNNNAEEGFFILKKPTGSGKSTFSHAITNSFEHLASPLEDMKKKILSTGQLTFMSLLLAIQSHFKI